MTIFWLFPWHFLPVDGRDGAGRGARVELHADAWDAIAFEYKPALL